MKTGIIYRATFPSKKVYIGQTIQVFKIRINDHYYRAFNTDSNTMIANAIRKYGKDNTKWEILYKNIPRHKLNDLEVKTIADYNSFYNGYNLTTGGGAGFSISKETRRKLSEAGKKRRHSEETKKTMSKDRKGKSKSKGWHHSEEAKLKISKSKIGKSHSHSEETKLKISKANSGKRGNRAKLTLTQVKEIRLKYQAGIHTQKQLSEEYSISIQAISDILTNKTWK